MIKREQTFTTKFQRWLKYKWNGGSAYFEIKATTKNYLSFSDVKKHQKLNLRSKRIIYKFTDALRWGTIFDVMLCEGKGYVVINYKYPSKEFFVCPIDVFLEEENISDRKSLTESRAREICRLEVLG